jgi:peptidyl-tRNA hydrolase
MTCLRRRRRRSRSQGNRKIVVKVTFLQYFFKLEGSFDVSGNTMAVLCSIKNKRYWFSRK